MVKLLTKAIRSADEFEDRGAVGEPIQEGGGHAFIAAHDTAPLSKAQIGGDDEGDSFVQGRTLINKLQSSLIHRANSSR